MHRDHHHSNTATMDLHHRSNINSKARDQVRLGCGWEDIKADIDQV
jgi:hypothetical protein